MGRSPPWGPAWISSQNGRGHVPSAALLPRFPFPPIIVVHALCQKKVIFPRYMDEVSIPCGRRVLSPSYLVP